MIGIVVLPKISRMLMLDVSQVLSLYDIVYNTKSYYALVHVQNIYTRPVFSIVRNKVAK